MLKKTTIAVLGLAASGLATAGAMGPVCTPGNVTVPCVAQMWELGADALYLNSIYSAGKGYHNSSPVLSRFKDTQNDWNWGYRLVGAYHFNTGNDVTINYMHFSSTGDQVNLLGFTPIPIPGGLLQLPMTYVSRDRLDQVNLVMGQHADFGLRKKMRFYGGMQYANIQATSNSYFATNPIVAVALGGSGLSQFDNTDYKGFGPNFGIDYSYAIMNGFSLTANGGGSILYGTTHYHAGYVATTPKAIISQVSASKKAIVPSLEAKLGLNYAYPMAQGVVNIDAGYQVVNYFKPLNAQAITIPGASPIVSVNYGVYGPYFGLKYVGNA